MTSRRPMIRSYSGNGRSDSQNGEDSPAPSGRSDSRNYLSNVRPENSYSSQRYSHYRPSRSTFCTIMAQLTEETQPCFETTIKSKAVSESCNVKFTCVVTGYPEPELTWYKDDMELDRYCGLPKYEIFRNGKTHSLHIYNCTVDDAAIYQASARNSKGIVSCSGVLEVGTMSEYKIHQRFFAKLKQKAELKRRELEESRRRGKENAQQEHLSIVSQDRSLRKRRSPGGSDPLSSPSEAQDAVSQETQAEDQQGATTEETNGITEAVKEAGADSIKENGDQQFNHLSDSAETVTPKSPTIDSLGKKKKRISNGFDEAVISEASLGAVSTEDIYDEGISLAKYLAQSLQSQIAEENTKLTRAEEIMDVDERVEEERERQHEREIGKEREQDIETAMERERESEMAKERERELEMAKRIEKEREMVEEREREQARQMKLEQESETKMSGPKESEHQHKSALSSVFHSLKGIFFGKGKKSTEKAGVSKETSEARVEREQPPVTTETQSYSPPTSFQEPEHKIMICEAATEKPPPMLVDEPPPSVNLQENRDSEERIPLVSVCPAEQVAQESQNSVDHVQESTSTNMEELSPTPERPPEATTVSLKNSLEEEKMQEEIQEEVQETRQKERQSAVEEVLLPSPLTPFEATDGHIQTDSSEGLVSEGIATQPCEVNTQEFTSPVDQVMFTAKETHVLDYQSYLNDFPQSLESSLTCPNTSEPERTEHYENQPPSPSTFKEDHRPITFLTEPEQEKEMSVKVHREDVTPTVETKQEGRAFETKPQDTSFHVERSGEESEYETVEKPVFVEENLEGYLKTEKKIAASDESEQKNNTIPAIEMDQEHNFVSTLEGNTDESNIKVHEKIATDLVTVAVQCEVESISASFLEDSVEKNNNNIVQDQEKGTIDVSTLEEPIPCTHECDMNLHENISLDLVTTVVESDKVISVPAVEVSTEKYNAVVQDQGSDTITGSTLGEHVEESDLQPQGKIVTDLVTSALKSEEESVFASALKDTVDKNYNIIQDQESSTITAISQVETTEMETETSSSLLEEPKTSSETQTEKELNEPVVQQMIPPIIILPDTDETVMERAEETNVTPPIPEIKVIVSDQVQSREPPTISSTNILRSESKDTMPSPKQKDSKSKTEKRLDDAMRASGEMIVEDGATVIAKLVGVTPSQYRARNADTPTSVDKIQDVKTLSRETRMGSGHELTKTSSGRSRGSDNNSIPVINIACADNNSPRTPGQEQAHEKSSSPPVVIVPQETPHSVPPISVTHVDSIAEQHMATIIKEKGTESLAAILRGVKSNLDYVGNSESATPSSGSVLSKEQNLADKNKHSVPSQLSPNITESLMAKTPQSSPASDTEKSSSSTMEKLGLTTSVGPTLPPLSPASLRRLMAKNNPNLEAQSSGSGSVPSITVDGTEKKGDENSGGSTPTSTMSCESSPKMKRRDSLTLIPSATPEELASGARRKIYLARTKTEEGEGSSFTDGQGKKDSPYMSPSQARRSAFLQAQSGQKTPPTERRSPLLARRKATLEVPKPKEETTEEKDTSKTENKPAEKEKLDPFKAPQVIRKIRGEVFSDASGHLKLWCQFFNVLSDSTIKWSRDEEEIAEMKRSGGDESQVALAIVQACSRDCGVYGCTITNEYGTDTTDFLLSADILAEFFLRDDLEVGEEIEMTPMQFTKGLADSGYWGDKFFGRIMTEEIQMGEGCAHKTCRVKAIYGLDPVFESGSTCITKVRNPIAYGTKEHSNLAERNLEITKQECKIQNTIREYCKIFAAEARVLENFGFSLEVIPVYLMYRPANAIPYATVEADLKGVYLRYCLMDSTGRLVTRTISEVEQKCCTFQHWIYQWTNGNLLVTQLEGVNTRITNVRIATKTKGYQGLTEVASPKVLEQFMTQHQCNYYCGLLSLRPLKPMDTLQQPPKIKSSRSPLLGRKLGTGSSSPQAARKGNSSPKVVKKTGEAGDNKPTTSKHKTVEVPKAVRMR
ncbi:alpha-protein kinase 3 [Chanos chanos]|uniref:non-specific serine/threonine protein kinase n=1 Tax=Chanos chanos TaxID=29144 RepID=A0A6J2UPZ1_CHACN|nr:alpha-protein kinase 3-like [Chanos chanos]